jgi:hypothetical protein
MSWNNKEEIETTCTVQQWRVTELFTKLCKNVCLQNSRFYDQFTVYTQVCDSLDGEWLTKKLESNLGK